MSSSNSNSNSNSIMSEKRSAAKIQRSKSFSEGHKPAMGEEREIQTSKSLPKEEHVVDITSPCVFRVPKALSETKPEAYAPRKLGLGPFHHFRPDLYPMRRKKFDDVIELVDADKGEEGLREIRRVLDYLLLKQHVIRRSYAESLDLNRSVLQRIIAIDAIYLLNCLNVRPDREDADAETARKVLSGDILMLENQIGGDLVLDIWKILKPGEGSVLSRNIRAFFEQESPLELMEKPVDILLSLKNGHLLNVLYNLILQREIKTDRRLIATREVTISEDNRKEEIRKVIRINGAAKFAERLGSGPQSSSIRESVVSSGAAPPPPMDFAGIAEAVSGVNQRGGDIMRKEMSILQKMPWGEFLNKLKNIDPDREENSAPVEEIRFPSASLLSRNAGIKFDLCTEKGIRNIKFDKKKTTLYLPPITLTSNSDIILRNLLAYEAAITKSRSTLEFTEYVELMCAIVDTPDDIRILRDAKVIAGDLKPTEIVRIFNGIWRSTRRDGEDEEKESSNIGIAIKGVNEVYGSRINVKVWRFINRRMYESWKLLAVASSAVALMLLALQAFCEIYDCNKHWFGGTIDQVGSFSSM